MISLIADSGHPDQPGLDTAIARALLLAADSGAIGETFRIHVPGRVVAFGKRDVVSPGYEDAVAAVQAERFAAVRRLAGGRAAVFHPGTLAFSWTIPEESPRTTITRRFTAISELMVRAFSRFGLDARIGEVPGEYCPGEWSVNLEGTHKVMGVGQRLTARAAHVGGVVVVSDAGEVNRPLLGAYRALGLEWRPEATGSLDQGAPGLEVSSVAEAIAAELAQLGDVAPGGLPEAVVAHAVTLLPDHLEADGQATATG
ncbi:MAG: lipoate--protein ligase family protein [Acidimicrobiia bacterium]|nr:lipoate--protein ligase family protein [Acidimicrobiia bacterium]NNF68365.1 lipoate--protein ligase family protein [Acidimicrobiia bacterium]NNK91590.1 lipoate--protein ligase family protein [Acidimicrobiia bacterium]